MNQPYQPHADVVRPRRGGRQLLALVLFGACVVACAAPGPPPADLLLRGGVVHTLDEQLPRASAVAIVGDRIAWVGSDREAEAFIGPHTRVMDLAGRTLLPGFTDSHLHLEGLGNLLEEVDLVGSTSYAEVVERVVARAAGLPPRTWITGRGWDQNDWPEESLPHHGPLSAALPDHPVALRRIDGHALLLNAAALDAAGIGPGTLPPDGGRIHFDDQGQPTGVLVDRAMDLVAPLLPRPTRAERRRRIEHAQILDPADIPRFAQLGVIPSMQTQHQTSDMPWAGARLGTGRLAGAYAWRSLLDTGVIIPNGSDAPVEAVDIPAAFRAAVTRTDEHGEPAGGWHPEQRMTRHEALASLTLLPALAAFREDDLGSITPGKRADLVLLSADPLTLPEDRLDQWRVLATFFGGRLVYGELGA